MQKRVEMKKTLVEGKPSPLSMSAEDGFFKVKSAPSSSRLTRRGRPKRSSSASLATRRTPTSSLFVPHSRSTSALHGYGFEKSSKPTPESVIGKSRTEIEQMLKEWYRNEYSMAGGLSCLGGISDMRLEAEVDNLLEEAAKLQRISTDSQQVSTSSPSETSAPMAIPTRRHR